MRYLDAMYQLPDLVDAVDLYRAFGDRRGALDRWIGQGLLPRPQRVGLVGLWTRSEILAHLRQLPEPERGNLRKPEWAGFELRMSEGIRCA